MATRNAVGPNDPGFASQQSLAFTNTTNTFDPATAQRLVNLHYSYPDLHPDVKVALAQTGLEPTHPAVVAAVDASRTVEAKKKSHGFFGSIESGLGSALGSVEHTIGHGLTAGVRGVMTGLSAVPEEGMGVLRTVAGGIGGRAGGFVAGALGGAATGAAAGSVVPGFGTVAAGLVGGAVGGFLGGKDIKGTGGLHAQSSLGIAAGHLLHGEKVDLGHGFFPSGSISGDTTDAQGNKVQSEQSRIQNQVASINGHALTPGRVVANSVFEPGSKPYSMLSGLVDFGTQIEETKIDPTFKALEEAGRLNGLRKSIDLERAGDFLKSESGVKLKQALIDEKSQWKIYEGSGKQFSLADSQAIAAADSVEKLDPILNRTMGLDVTRKFKLESQVNPVSRLLRGETVQRLMAPVSQSAKAPEHADAVLEQWDAMQRISKVPEAERIANNEKLMDGLVKLKESGQPPPASEFSPTNWRTDPPKPTDVANSKRAQAVQAMKQNDTFEARLNKAFESKQITKAEFEQSRQRLDVLRGQASSQLRAAAMDDLKAMTTPAEQQLSLGGEAQGFGQSSLKGTQSVPAVDWTGEHVNPLAADPLAMLHDPGSVTRAAAAENGIDLGGHDVLVSDMTSRVGGDVTGDRIAAQRRAIQVAKNNIHPAFQGMLDSMESSLVSHGVDAKQAKEMTTIWQDDMLQLRKHIADSIGNNEPLPGVIHAGKTIGIPNESALAEMLRAGVAPPDPRDMRREVSKFSGILRYMHLQSTVGVGVHGSAQIMDYVMSRVWKPMQIIRGALPIRVLAEEHARMAASGMDSFFTHPFSTVAMAHAIEEGSALTITGEPLRLADKASEAVSGGAKDAFDVGNRRVKFKSRLKPKDGPSFISGWKDSSLRELRGNALHQVIAANGEQAGVEYLTGNNPEGIETLKKLRGGTSDTNFLRTREQIQAYVHEQAAHVQDMTRGDPLLLRYVADGVQDPATEGAARKAIKPKLEQLWRDGNTPDRVVSDSDIKDPKLYDRMLNRAFTTIMQNPSTKYARLPWYSQKYWARVEELMPDLTEEAKSAVLNNAHASEGLPTGTIGRLEARAAKAPAAHLDAAARLSLEHADTLAHGSALESVKETLYDLGRKSNWADASRLVFPFAEPWQQSIKHWSGIMMDHPQILRRVEQGVQGARGSGFFYNDPTTGEEMFAYPGSEFITKHLVGAPVKFGGAVKGLNMFAENPVMPGFGPIAQVSADQILQHKPELDWLLKTVDPRYGSDTRGTLEKFATPAAWMDKVRKIAASPENDRDFANTSYEMARYLVSTGDYNLNSQDAIDKTNKAAVGMARKMYALRSLASFSLPAAPQLTYKGVDEQGHYQTQTTLINEFRKMQTEDYSTATQKFVDKFGPDALLYMQPRSKGGGPPVEDLYKWAQKNPQLTRQYEDVFSYFGPHAGAYSPSYYDEQIAKGTRKSLTPDEAEKLANGRIGQMVWRQAKDKVGSNPSTAQADWLDNVKSGLMKAYPGFDPFPKDIGKVPRQIEQITAAMDDPRMAKTPAGEAAKVYLMARDKALAAAKAAGDKGFDTAKGQAGTRQWLRQVGAAIAQAEPAFADMWEQVFDREMKVDEVKRPTLPEETA